MIIEHSLSYSNHDDRIRLIRKAYDAQRVEFYEENIGTSIDTLLWSVLCALPLDDRELFVEIANKFKG